MTTSYDPTAYPSAMRATHLLLGPAQDAECQNPLAHVLAMHSDRAVTTSIVAGIRYSTFTFQDERGDTRAYAILITARMPDEHGHCVTVLFFGDPARARRAWERLGLSAPEPLS